MRYEFRKKKNKPTKKVTEKFFNIEKKKKWWEMRWARSPRACRAHNSSTFINQFNFCRSAWEPGRPVLGSLRHWRPSDSDR